MITRSIRERPLIWFFILAFMVSWGSCLPFVLMGPRGYPVLFFLGALGPTVAACTVAAVVSGKAGLKDLLGGILRWQVHPRWWLLALLSAPFMMAVARGILAIKGTSSGGFPSHPPSAHITLPVLLVSLPFFALLEEIGWRGFALPKLESRHGPLRAAVILGSLWALWHLPLFLLPGTSHSGMQFGPYLAFAMVLCLWFAWLYRRTRSILLVSVFHASINFTGFLGGGSPGAEIVFGALIIILTFILLLPKLRYSRLGNFLH